MEVVEAADSCVDDGPEPVLAFAELSGASRWTGVSVVLGADRPGFGVILAVAVTDNRALLAALELAAGVDAAPAATSAAGVLAEAIFAVAALAVLTEARVAVC